jgi:hypothetical protein
MSEQAAWWIGWWIGLFAVCSVFGIISAVARARASGFWWGFLIGPIGIIVAAILRVSDSRAPAPADRTLASTRLAHLARPAPARRVTLIRRPAPVEIVPCGHCAGSINVAGVSGRFACPHCQGSLEV